MVWRSSNGPTHWVSGQRPMMTPKFTQCNRVSNRHPIKLELAGHVCLLLIGPDRLSSEKSIGYWWMQHCPLISCLVLCNTIPWSAFCPHIHYISPASQPVLSTTAYHQPSVFIRYTCTGVHWPVVHGHGWSPLVCGNPATLNSVPTFATATKHALPPEYNVRGAQQPIGLGPVYGQHLEGLLWPLASRCTPPWVPQCEKGGLQKYNIICGVVL